MQRAERQGADSVVPVLVIIWKLTSPHRTPPHHQHFPSDQAPGADWRSGVTITTNNLKTPPQPPPPPPPPPPTVIQAQLNYFLFHRIGLYQKVYFACEDFCIFGVHFNFSIFNWLDYFSFYLSSPSSPL